MSDLLDLDALIDPRLKVRLDGEEVPVVPIDAIGYRLSAEQSAADGPEAIQIAYKIAARCLPSLPEERVLRMSAAQVGAVCRLATQGVEKVEAAIPPNSAPAGGKRKKAKE